MKKINILIADDIKETRDLLEKVLTLDNENFNIIGEAINGEEAIEKCENLKPDIILMDINMPVLNGLKATEAITEKFDFCDVIIMSVQNDVEYLKTAMSSGAKGYILKPIDSSEIAELINTTYNKSKEKREKVVNKIESKKGEIISFYSFKGGVGKSVLALNTSVLLSKKINKKVLLIDLDLQFGDISLLTNKHTEKNILDLIDDEMTNSYNSIKAYLHSYTKDLDILFAPLNPEGADYVSKDIVEKIIEISKKYYDIIVIDTGVNFDEHTLFVLDISDSIYLISSMEMSSLKNTKLGLSVMKSLNYSEKKIKIIINEANEKFGVSKKDIEKVFDYPVHAYIPEDIKNIRNSVNKGIALCLEPRNKGLKLYKKLLEMCKAI